MIGRFTFAAPLYAAAGFLFGDLAPSPAYYKLDPASRIKALAALAALVILGAALVLLVWWGAVSRVAI